MAEKQIFKNAAEAAYVDWQFSIYARRHILTLPDTGQNGWHT